ncbi:hypothetical protein [Acinetobacter pragensis]|uniref:Lipoprotein n=1 Tax=Acinetobacter pragensis TaxID=1806892 RepID=A0A151Y0E0_9GAMM|nr:hypothetical protein [Acinetobacter pragensis]KYQ71506.1 hypothetical protein AZH43_14260 [Acinetobacter pragensis]
MNLIMNCTAKYTALLSAGLLLALTACSKAPDGQKVRAEKYATVPEATKALDAESGKIDQLIVQLGQAASEAEQKKLSCEQIPAHYARMLAILEANQHLMTASDQKIQQDFKQLTLEQKRNFESSPLCKL